MEIILPVRVFLSHPSDKDKERVETILKKMSPHIELNMFPTTDYELDFTEAIRRSIEDADVLFVILNEKGRSNQWVNQEVGIAVARDISIVVLAEENAKKEHLLRGFVNEKNRTIIYIDKDDLEDKLQLWLGAYQEKHGSEILQRLILEDFKIIRRVCDAQKMKYIESHKDIKGYFVNLEANIDQLFELVRNLGFIPIFILDKVTEFMTKLMDSLSQNSGIVLKEPDKFKVAVNNSNIFEKINKYNEIRNLES
jgi:hypothetical protein